MKKRTLKVYGDETGTMPQADEDKPFVCACVGVTGQLRRVSEPQGRPAWLLEYLRQNQAIPHVCYVQPHPGYRRALTAAHSQREQMALITRAQTGSNAPYVPESGLSLANEVWGKVMLVAIGHLALTAAALGPVDRIEVILDQKTMKPETRTLFRRMTSRIGPILIHEGRKARHKDPVATDYINGNLRFTNDVSLTWSDELKKEPFGLKIADLLGYLSWKELSRPDGHFLLDPLRNTNLGASVTDITDVITAPVSDDHVREWKERTYGET